MAEEAENNQDAMLDKAVEQFLAARLRGEEPDLNQFVRQYPGLEEKIRQKIQKCQRVGSLFDSLREVDETEFQNTRDEADLIGQKLGNFEIGEVIGQGGMGVVYLAHDTKLDRSVAIKSMPSGLLSNSTAQTRFKREAKLLASLSHPNIAVIHEIIEKGEGANYLVLEYVPGETLAERITEGPLKLQEALTIAFQIAEAVAAAHDHNVIHRDLKPGNIKITPDSRVKVLDFGLAKALGGTDVAQKSTVTQPGRVIGTPAYMSPEQARGKPTDKRCDIWSFGCLLYEILTGKIPFEGETVSDTLANVLQTEPDWQALPQSTPSNIQVLLRRCLEKDPQRRLRDIGDAAIEISETLHLPATAPPVTSPSISLEPENTVKANSIRIAMMIAAIIIIALSAITVWFIMERRTQPISEQIRQVMAFNVELPEDISMPMRGTISISPDGTHIAFIGQKAGIKQIYLRPLKRPELIPVKGTDGAIIAFFSHDSQWLGYATKTRLWKVDLGGGQPIPICNVSEVHSAFWAQDDTIIFGSNQYWTLARVKASGEGVPQLVTQREGPREWVHTDPEVLPGGKTVIFNTHDGGGLGGLKNIVIQSLVTGERKTLVEGAFFPRYAASGHLVYESGEFMKARPFDVDTLDFTGPAVDIEGIRWARFSRQGTLAWVPSVPTEELMLLWVDREGNETPVTEKRKEYYGPRVSPDGNRLAFWVGGTDSHVWIHDLQNSQMNRLTSAGLNFWCSWSPDGSQIAFTSLRPEETAGAYNLYLKAADGSGSAVQLTEGPYIDNPISWTGDGKSIIVQRSNHPQTGRDVMLLPLNGDRMLQPLLNSHANESRGELSPDGRWLAYVITEAGSSGVFVQAFQNPKRKWPISPAGTFAGDPLWSPDGKELFYRDLDAEKIMVVDVETTDEFTAGTPRILFDDCYLEHLDLGRTYDITPDGKRFVMVKEVNPPPRQITVIYNWFEELKRLAPTRKD